MVLFFGGPFLFYFEIWASTIGWLNSQEEEGGYKEKEESDSFQILNNIHIAYTPRIIAIHRKVEKEFAKGIYKRGLGANGEWGELNYVIVKPSYINPRQLSDVW